ncbi:hypothetical protein HYC85_007971 [Camellia sinensis]|uniref:EXS domain-containing protein n=1 Tax=Camellia sinensis TaxID=4442 RepID=A0A7J7HRE2_CAMSI|nr:hypothetical protein HYC85_007971 [Camellia sinensis]
MMKVAWRFSSLSHITIFNQVHRKAVEISIFAGEYVNEYKQVIHNAAVRQHNRRHCRWCVPAEGVCDSSHEPSRAGRRMEGSQCDQLHDKIENECLKMLIKGDCLEGTELGCKDVLLLSFGVVVFAIAGALANLAMEMDPKTQRFEEFTELVPQALLGVQGFRSLEFYICYYGWGDYKNRETTCQTNNLYKTLYFIIAAIPYWSRFLQSFLASFMSSNDPYRYVSISVVVLRYLKY